MGHRQSSDVDRQCLVQPERRVGAEPQEHADGAGRNGHGDEYVLDRDPSPDGDPDRDPDGDPSGNSAGDPDRDPSGDPDGDPAADPIGDDDGLDRRRGE
jgi:hypothetical protein